MFMSLFEEFPEILEVTLRDGSYLIDFQFTTEDTVTIASALEAVGFRWIEVGHGVGLNASMTGKGHAAVDDEEYLEATSEAIKTARWGMFFIPGIGRAEDLRMAARYNMSFVRIGANITEIDEAQPFISLAKELGLIVSFNAMKSYTVSPMEFGRCAAKTHEWGADIVYLVDSAGGMYPDDISAYLKAAQNEIDVPLGFHGHDNLSLCMANTLRAIECGAVLVDSSLQGMGRSAGNAITEVLVAIMKQRGFLPRIDQNQVMDIGQGLIQPLMRQKSMDPMAITAGSARFHSSFTPKVQRFAKKYQIDARDLIARLCQEDQVDASDVLLERLSQELAAEKVPRVISIPAFGIKNSMDMSGLEALLRLIKELRPRAIKAAKFSTINIVIGETPQEEINVSGNIQSTPAHMVGSITLTDKDQLVSALDAIDGLIDSVFLDVDRKTFTPDSPAQIACQRLKKTQVLTYLDSRVWVDAMEDQVVRLLDENLDNVTIVIAGDHPKARFLALRCAERRAEVTMLVLDGAEANAAYPETMRHFSFAPNHLNVSYLNLNSPDALKRLRQARLVVVWPSDKPWFGNHHARHLAEGTYVIDAGIGAMLPEGLQGARRRGALLIRINIWPALSGALSAAHESARVVRDSLGWGTLNGLPVVAGGAMGKPGDIVVDSISEPTRVIGIADGLGGVLFSYGHDDVEKVRRVSEEINRRLVMPRLSKNG
jgi:4-hydroxy-2-oxovalerate aldolase